MRSPRAGEVGVSMIDMIQDWTNLDVEAQSPHQVQEHEREEKMTPDLLRCKISRSTHVVKPWALSRLMKVWLLPHTNL